MEARLRLSEGGGPVASRLLGARVDRYCVFIHITCGGTWLSVQWDGIDTGCAGSRPHRKTAGPSGWAAKG